MFSFQDYKFVVDSLEKVTNDKWIRKIILTYYLRGLYSTLFGSAVVTDNKDNVKEIIKYLGYKPTKEELFEGINVLLLRKNVEIATYLENFYPETVALSLNIDILYNLLNLDYYDELKWALERTNHEGKSNMSKVNKLYLEAVSKYEIKYVNLILKYRDWNRGERKDWYLEMTNFLLNFVELGLHERVKTIMDYESRHLRRCMPFEDYVLFLFSAISTAFDHGFDDMMWYFNTFVISDVNYDEMNEITTELCERDHLIVRAIDNIASKKSKVINREYINEVLKKFGFLTSAIIENSE